MGIVKQYLDSDSSKITLQCNDRIDTFKNGLFEHEGATNKTDL